MKKFTRFYYGFFIVSLLFYLYINFNTLYNGQFWGGDFAQYFIHARNLLNHKPYSSGIYSSGTMGYPPGYPVLILPFYKIFGINFIPAKILNIIFWLACIYFVFRTLKNNFDTDIALLGSIAFLLSPFLFVFKHQALPDVIFTFFIIACDSDRVMTLSS